MEIEGRQLIQYKLRKYRKLCGLKQDTVRRHIGLSSRSVLSDWENGKSYPSLPRLLDLAKLYHCKPSDLYPELDQIPGKIDTAPEEEF